MDERHLRAIYGRDRRHFQVVVAVSVCDASAQTRQVLCKVKGEDEVV